MKMVMEASLKEERERQERIKQVEEKETKIIQQISEVSIKEAVPVPEPKVAELRVVEEVKEAPLKAMKAVEPAKQGYSLPPVALRKGGMGGFDPALLQQQRDAILKGLDSMESEI